MIASEVMRNAPPSHAQLEAVVLIAVLVLLFVVAMFTAFFVAVRRDRAEEDA